MYKMRVTSVSNQVEMMPLVASDDQEAADLAEIFILSDVSTARLDVLRPDGSILLTRTRPS